MAYTDEGKHAHTYAHEHEYNDLKGTLHALDYSVRGDLVLAQGVKCAHSSSCTPAHTSASMSILGITCIDKDADAEQMCGPISASEHKLSHPPV